MLITGPFLQGTDGQLSAFSDALGTTCHREDVSIRLWAAGGAREQRWSEGPDEAT